jgi:RNA-binding protein
MALNGKKRRDLIARSHRLKVAATLAVGEVSEGAVQHVRGLLSEHGLVKIRVHGGGREECEAITVELAERVPCEVVARIGRVILLYPPEEADGVVG